MSLGCGGYRCHCMQGDESMNASFLFGRAAFNEGKSMEANPHEHGTRRWWDWYLGYRAAEMAWYAEIN